MHHHGLVIVISISLSIDQYWNTIQFTYLVHSVDERQTTVMMYFLYIALHQVNFLSKSDAKITRKPLYKVRVYIIIVDFNLLYLKTLFVYLEAYRYLNT